MSAFCFMVLMCSTHYVWAQQVRSDSLTVQDLKAMGIRFTSDNSVTLLESGFVKFEDMFEAIRQAKSFVHLEYFNFRNDSIGAELFTLLAQKAKEGVKVRALFDGWGNTSNDQPLKDYHLERIRESGVEIYEFDPMRFPWLNHAIHRDHRKIVVVDGQTCYTGGMNVADYYLHGRPEFGSWRDMHIRIEGSAVADYEDIFRVMWAEVTGEQLDDAMFYPTPKSISEHFTGLRPDTCVTAGNKMVGVVDRDVRKNPDTMCDAYISAIDNAQQHIRIINPYPTLVGDVKRALYRALKRGVKLEFMVSSKSDIPISPDVTAYRMRKLMKRGADVYFYNPGFHHSKVMMVDSTYCTVGSTNLNSRSLRFDYEVNAFIMDASTTAALNRIFEADKDSSSYMTPENWKQLIPVKQRIRGWFWSIFAPLM